MGAAVGCPTVLPHCWQASSGTQTIIGTLRSPPASYNEAFLPGGLSDSRPTKMDCPLAKFVEKLMMPEDRMRQCGTKSRGAVAYLNARPLVSRCQNRPPGGIVIDLPSRLADALAAVGSTWR